MEALINIICLFFYCNYYPIVLHAGHKLLLVGFMPTDHMDPILNVGPEKWYKDETEKTQQHNNGVPGLICCHIVKGLELPLN